MNSSNSSVKTKAAIGNIIILIAWAIPFLVTLILVKAEGYTGIWPFMIPFLCAISVLPNLAMYNISFIMRKKKGDQGKKDNLRWLCYVTAVVLSFIILVIPIGRVTLTSGVSIAVLWLLQAAAEAVVIRKFNIVIGEIIRQTES